MNCPAGGFVSKDCACVCKSNDPANPLKACEDSDGGAGGGSDGGTGGGSDGGAGVDPGVTEEFTTNSTPTTEDFLN